MSGILINLIIQLISGAVGGNVVASAAKNIDLGTLGNSIAGAIGGGVGGQILGYADSVARQHSFDARFW